MNTMTATAAATKVKGPIVWLNMDQQELDDAYDQIVYAPNRDQVGKRRLANSAAALARLGKPLRFAYGPTPIEGLDVYRSPKPNAPIAIFVHGGAWRNGTAAEFTCLAEPFVHAGAHFVVLDFTNVDDAKGSLFPMVEQVRRAVGWVYRNAEKFGGDRNRLHLISHSSGSHLAGCTVTHDWAKDELPLDILKGATLSSGMYDLKPVRLSKRSKYVAFTDEMEKNAQRHAPSRQAQHAAHSDLRHLRDAGIPAPVARLRRRGESRRQAGRATGRRRLQSFRNAGDAGEPVRAARPRGADADEIDAGLNQAAAGRSVSGSIVLHTEVRMSSAPQRLQA